MFRVGLLQFRPKFGDLDANREYVIDRLSNVGANLIVLPELPFTGYQFKNRKELASLAEDPERSLIVTQLVGVCVREKCHIITGFAERSRTRSEERTLMATIRSRDT